MENLPAEIVNAMETFRRYETSTYPQNLRQLHTLHDAFTTLDNYLKNNPQTPHKELINEIKISNTRNFIRHLPELKEINESDWRWSWIILHLHGVDIQNDIIEKNPELREIFNTFSNLYSKESFIADLKLDIKRRDKKREFKESLKKNDQEWISGITGVHKKEVNHNLCFTGVNFQDTERYLRFLLFLCNRLCNRRGPCQKTQYFFIILKILFPIS